MLRPHALVFVTLSIVACSNKTPPGPAPATRLEECETLDGRERADECYEKHAAKVAKVTFCERIVGPRTKNSCFSKLAATAGDGEACAKIDESTARGTCRSAIAKSKGDPALCTKIEKPELAATCLTDIAKNKKDPAICDSITAVPAKNDCLVALAGHKPEVCDRIAEQPAKDDCYTRAQQAPHMSKDGPILCDKMSDVSKKDTCWAVVASRRDALLCEKASSDFSRDACWKLAVIGSNTNVDCAKVERAAGVDACHAAVAVRLRDAARCEKIADAEKKKKCTSDITAAAVTPKPAVNMETVRAGITKVSDTEFIVSRTVVDAILSDQQEMMKSVRIVPEMQAGKTVGIKLFGVRPDSVPALLGFQSGDRLEKINGFDMTSPEKALEVYTNLSKATKIEVDLTRQSEPTKLTYTLK
jgi:hypothetical protein